jgi:hypothetical protein
MRFEVRYGSIHILHYRHALCGTWSQYIVLYYINHCTTDSWPWCITGQARGTTGSNCMMMVIDAHAATDLPFKISLILLKTLTHAYNITNNANAFCPVILTIYAMRHPVTPRAIRLWIQNSYRTCIIHVHVQVHVYTYLYIIVTLSYTCRWMLTYLDPPPLARDKTPPSSSAHLKNIHVEA